MAVEKLSLGSNSLKVEPADKELVELEESDEGESNALINNVLSIQSPPAMSQNSSL